MPGHHPARPVPLSRGSQEKMTGPVERLCLYQFIAIYIYVCNIYIYLCVIYIYICNIYILCNYIYVCICIYILHIYITISFISVCMCKTIRTIRTIRILRHLYLYPRWCISWIMMQQISFRPAQLSTSSEACPAHSASLPLPPAG